MTKPACEGCERGLPLSVVHQVFHFKVPDGNPEVFQAELIPCTNPHKEEAVANPTCKFCGLLIKQLWSGKDQAGLTGWRHVKANGDYYYQCHGSSTVATPEGRIEETVAEEKSLVVEALEDSLKQAMVRAYAKSRGGTIKEAKRQFDLGRAGDFEAGWAVGSRRGLDRARELCQARAVRGEDAVDCVTDIDEAITAAMPAKEGE